MQPSTSQGIALYIDVFYVARLNDAMPVDLIIDPESMCLSPYIRPGINLYPSSQPVPATLSLVASDCWTRQMYPCRT